MLPPRRAYYYEVAEAGGHKGEQTQEQEAACDKAAKERGVGFGGDEKAGLSGKAYRKPSKS